MRKIIIKLKEDSDFHLLKKLLKEADFESEIETVEEDLEIQDETYQLLEERWEEYKRNPSSSTDLEALKGELKKKYGV